MLNETGKGLRHRTIGTGSNKSNHVNLIGADVDENIDGDGIGKSKPRYVYDTSVPLYAGGIGLFDRFHLLLLDARTFIMIPIRFITTLFTVIGYFLSILYPLLIWLFFIWLFWYLAIIFWPYLIKVILVVFIPILNVLIILFNLFFMIFIIILTILIMIWNIIVPFIGMLIYVVINVILTILADVFNIIGSVNWEPIISAIMNILMVLVDIAMQILLVLIKVGMEILTAVSNIISVLMEVILTAVKIILPIVVWIVQILFKVLEPILKVIAIFFGGIASMFGRMATGRALLSVSLSPVIFNTTEIPYRDPYGGGNTWGSRMKEESDEDMRRNNEYVHFIETTLGVSRERDDYIYSLYARSKEMSTNSRILSDNYHYDEILNLEDDLLAATPKSASFSDFASTSYGRKILQSWGKKNSGKGLLRFVDEEQEEEKLYEVPKESSGDGPSESVLNDAAHTIAHTFYTSARNMHPDDMKLSQEIFDHVHAESRRKDNLAMKTLLQDFSKNYLHLHPKFEDTLSSVRYTGTPEHPRDMHARFHEERKKHETMFMHNSGRKLMSNENDWDEAKKNYLSQKRIEDARALIAQEEAYKKYHTDRMKVATVVYGATTRSLKHSVEIGVTPENIIKHWDETLKYFGYMDMKHIHDEFVEKYGDAAGYLVSFSTISEHPLLRYFKKSDKTVAESPYYHDWAIEQRKLVEARAKNNAENGGSGRKLLGVTQQNEDREVAGSKESQESLGGFATLSTLNCFSSPKNPLCIPEIPAGFSFKIPQIRLTDKQKETIETSIFECTPWRATWCVICLDRFFNVWHEFRFLISTIPLINYPIATITVLAPWTGIFFNWIFLVPKFQVGSLFQFVCFVYHLYDVYIVGIAIWLFVKLVYPFWGIVVSTWNNIRASRLQNKMSYGARKRLDDINYYLLKMQRRGEIAAKIGAGIHIDDDTDSVHAMRRARLKRAALEQRKKMLESSGVINSSQYEARIGTLVNNNNVVVHHHHHHHHHHQEDDYLLEDERINHSSSLTSVAGSSLTLAERRQRDQEELLALLEILRGNPDAPYDIQQCTRELLQRFSDNHFDLTNEDHDPHHVHEIARSLRSHPIHQSLRLKHKSSQEYQSTSPICSSSATDVIMDIPD
jgi:hypothetical protein